MEGVEFLAEGPLGFTIIYCEMVMGDGSEGWWTDLRHSGCGLMPAAEVPRWLVCPDLGRAEGWGQWRTNKKGVIRLQNGDGSSSMERALYVQGQGRIL